MFDILGTAIQGARVLDAAAGSGAYGIEALSRGARQASFVESDRRVLRVLERNLKELSIDGRVFAETVGRFAARRDAAGFDVVFHDPPWGADRRQARAIAG